LRHNNLKLMQFEEFIDNAILEDIKDWTNKIPQGDHSANSCIPLDAQKRAQLKIKDNGVIAGIDVAVKIFHKVDPQIEITHIKKDGDVVKSGEIAFEVQGNARSILLSERLVLNTMQRMSGIATKTNEFAKKIAHTNCKVLDTRKTTPNFRWFEKLAVKIGGGSNHRFGLYDMIMLKDNHVDYCGGIKNAIERASEYKSQHHIDIPIEVETRNLDEVREVLETKCVQRIMLDNFSVEQCREAVIMINKEVEVEASGGITLDTIVSYAESGVDFVSVGSLTYSYKSLDLSLKATN